MKKIIVSSDSLKPALQKIGQAVNPKSVLPILLNIFCKVSPGKLEMITCNVEITIYYRLECEAKESFEFLIPFDFLNRIIAINKHCPLEIEASSTKVKIKGPDDNYEIKIGDKIEDLPTLHDLPKKNSFTISQDVLNCLSLAMATTCNADKNPKLANVLLELAPGKITVASSDGAYMVYSKEFDSDQQETEELLISQKAINVLKGSDSIKVAYHSRAIGFETETITVVNTRSADKFVNFRQVFPPDWPANLKVMKDVLLGALNKCALCNDELYTTVINLDQLNQLKLNASDSTLQVAVAIPGNYTGEVKEISINASKLSTLLHQIEQPEISLAVHDSKKAIILSTDEDPAYKGMIMPIATK